MRFMVKKTQRDLKVEDYEARFLITCHPKLEVESKGEDEFVSLRKDTYCSAQLITSRDCVVALLGPAAAFDKLVLVGPLDDCRDYIVAPSGPTPATACRSRQRVRG
jgi:hypothetical protein